MEQDELIQEIAAAGPAVIGQLLEIIVGAAQIAAPDHILTASMTASLKLRDALAEQ